MTTIETVLDNEHQEQKRSRIATAALVCSLIICCPLVTLVAPILGVIALMKIRNKPYLKGKGFAWSGIIIGTIATAISTVGGIFIVTMAIKFIEDTTHITSSTLVAGYEGDYETFRSGLTATSANVTDEEIQVFIDELRERYGNFDTVVMNMESQNQELQTEELEIVLPIRLVFESSDIGAEIMVHIEPSRSGFDFSMYFNCIKIFDPVDGDIVFPEGSDCDIEPTTVIGEKDTDQ